MVRPANPDQPAAKAEPVTASLSELPFVDYQYPTKDPAGGRIAIIGEAPGAEEARTGKPFRRRQRPAAGREPEVRRTGPRHLPCRQHLPLPAARQQGIHFFSSRTKARKLGVEVAEDLGPMGTSDYCLAKYAGEIEHLRRTLNEIKPAVGHRAGPHADVGADRPERHHGPARPGTPLPPPTRTP